jgi:hypothetical protein
MYNTNAEILTHLAVDTAFGKWMILCPRLLQFATTVLLECIHRVEDRDLLVVLIPDQRMRFIYQNRWT